MIKKIRTSDYDERIKTAQDLITYYEDHSGDARLADVSDLLDSMNVRIAELSEQLSNYIAQDIARSDEQSYQNWMRQRL